jgi:monoamine oxidase
MSKNYDIIVLGGGIAGIYTVYTLSKIIPDVSILLLEESERFGGRVHTAKYGLEAGAGRFSSKHTLLLELIRELGLEKKMKKSNASAKYIPIQNKPEKTTNSIFSSVLGWYTGSTVNPLTELVATVVLASKLERRSYLQSVTFTEYAKTILKKDDIQYIHDSFGYYSELVIMNAYDAIQLIENLDPKNTFYTLKDGLSQIIDVMIQKIPKQKAILKKNHKVINIKREKSTDQNPIYSISCDNGKVFYTNKIIAALPKQALEKISIFKPLLPDLKKIVCAPLCRIYSKFKSGEWFKDLPKFTTNNNLRMVIPINPEKGTIMISYTDNKFAEYWKKLYLKDGIKKVNEKIAEYMRETTSKEIPKPIDTNVYYWPCGVGYWGINADSHSISEKMIKPFEKETIYICGEHYSEKNQQWMEGALETSISVIKKI